MKIERKKTTIEVWNVCECGNVLHSLLEAERGTCGPCWLKTMAPDTRKAMNKLVMSAFRPITDAEKDALIEDAMEKLDRDREASQT